MFSFFSGIFSASIATISTTAFMAALREYEDKSETDTDREDGKKSETN